MTQSTNTRIIKLRYWLCQTAIAKLALCAAAAHINNLLENISASCTEGYRNPSILQQIIILKQKSLDDERLSASTQAG